SLQLVFINLAKTSTYAKAKKINQISRYCLEPQRYRGEIGRRPRDASIFRFRRTAQRAPVIAPICIAKKIATTPCHGALNSKSMQRHTLTTTICVGIKVLRYCAHMSGLPKINLSIRSFYKDISFVARERDAEIAVEQR